jgi:hypothetical protein
MAAVSHRSLPRIHRWAGLSALAAVGLFTVCERGPFTSPIRVPPHPSSSSLRRSLDQNRGRWLLSLISIAVFVVAARGLRSVLIALEQDRLLADIAYSGISYVLGS